METTYTPNSHSQAIALPPIPTAVSLSANNPGNSLQRWFRGASSTPVPYFSPEAMEICEQRWKIKWDYYNQMFIDESLNNASRPEVYEHLGRIESEFARLKDRFVEIDAIKTSAEVAVGVQFVTSLIQGQDPAIYRMKVAEKQPLNDEQLQVIRQDIKTIDRVYHFAVQSSDAIHKMKLINMIRSRSTNVQETDVHEDVETSSQDGDVGIVPSTHGSQDFGSTPQLTSEKHGERVRFAHSSSPTRFSADDNTRSPAVLDDIMNPTAQATLGSSGGRAAHHRPISGSEAGRPLMERTRGYDRTNTLPPAEQYLSSVPSHRSNLGLLSGVSFFGAGMAWATVFSATRGDVVLISWAACCFIVGAVSAASATSLLDADGELINKYKPVRWTVRLLGVWAAFHAFVGIMLISAAILVLDPGANELGAGMGGASVGVKSERVAGGYSLVVCAIVVVIALVVRRRYSRRTWFV